jgi:hypothetical protein
MSQRMGQVLAFGFIIGEKHITLGLVLIAAACLYGALFAFRVLQLFLPSPTTSYAG